MTRNFFLNSIAELGCKREQMNSRLSHCSWAHCA